MALKMRTDYHTPSNVIIETDSDIIKRQLDQISKWKPRKDTWPFTYGVHIIGGVSALTGAYINHKFRSLMKMGDLGRFATMTIATMCPAVLGITLQMQYVLPQVLLPTEKCPLCIELKAMSIQNFCGVAYPCVLVPISNFMLAIRGQTHRIPYYKNYKELFTFCKTLYKPMIPHLMVLSIVNTIAAHFILYEQHKCLFNMRTILTIDQEIMENDKRNNIQV